MKDSREVVRMFQNNIPGGRPHIWHYCKIDKHEKCSGFGSLTERRDNPHRTYIVERVKGHGLANVYCECPCHATREVFNVAQDR